MSRKGKSFLAPIDREAINKEIERRKQNDYYYTKSSASNLISDITHIIYGGLTSRFWMMRKHFNSMTINQL